MLKKKLFQYQGYISAALVLGGVDVLGPHLYTVYPHGSTDSLPYVAKYSEETKSGMCPHIPELFARSSDNF